MTRQRRVKEKEVQIFTPYLNKGTRYVAWEDYAELERKYKELVEAVADGYVDWLKEMEKNT